MRPCVRRSGFGGCGRARSSARAFTFIEILFAVIVLGIGLIMVAAMMPVGLLQSQETLDQTIANQIAKGASESIQSIADDETMPQTIPTLEAIGYKAGTAPVWSFADATKYPPDGALRAWLLLKGKMVHSADPRYAWTAIYSREYNSVLTKAAPYAQIYVIVARVRNRPRYGLEDVQGPLPNLRPREVDVFLTEGTVNGVPGPDIIEFMSTWTGAYKGVDTPSAVAEGAYVVIGDDQQLIRYRRHASVDYQYPSRGLANGRVYRVGNRRTDLGPNKWELMPGWDMPSGPGCGGPGEDLLINTDDDNQNIPVTRTQPRYALPARALILGREAVDPSDARQFDGPAQDVAFFTTFVPVLR